MSETTSTQRATATLALVAACLAFGAAIGLMTEWLFASEPTAGWAALSDGFSGLFLGGVLGVVAGGYLARDLSVTARWWSTGVAVVLTAGTLWSIALTAS